MSKDKKRNRMDRRAFMKLSVAAAMSGKALMAEAASPDTEQAAQGDALIHRNERPTMAYQQLGRTNFMSSKLVFGGGAALSGGKGVRLLDRAFEAGINHYDLGSNVYYRGAEQHFAPFMKAHRDDIWVVSKAWAQLQMKASDGISTNQAKQAAEYWSNLLDGSLRDMKTDYIDAYYLMGISNPSLIKSEEIHNAFLKAKTAGKVGYFGVSTHENAEKVLQAMIETGWYDIAMIGITPAGWYDWGTKQIAKGTPTLPELKPLLQQAQKAGIGLVGMKTTRHLSFVKMYGNGSLDLFDHLYSTPLKKSPFNPFQQAYAYALENGLDVVNSDMQNFRHLEENIVAAASAHQYVTSI
jgi:predicted aldo/keto reductase-like oxidoreductase